MVGVGVGIQGFANAEIERFFRHSGVPRRAGWSQVAKVALRKLDMLDYAEVLSDLASPPGDRLEALEGDLQGFHSIRINDQWQVVFRWTATGPADVDIRDYH
jgi:toxin HigB-1